MKKILFGLLIVTSFQSKAQVFIDKGIIEYEVKTNFQKSLGDGFWADMMRDKVPKMLVNYYSLTFNPDKSVYQFSRSETNFKMPWGGDNESNIWYNDFKEDRFVQQKNVFGDTYLLSDSLSNLKWKLTNESREIAGFNCRKAQAILFDSVYVFAFYTDEITVSGGPISLHGLPGMILGVTIPRLYTSWIATKLQVAGVDENKIQEPKKGKKSKGSVLKTKVEDATKEWGTYGQQEVWKIFF